MKKLQFVKSKLKEWNEASFGDLKEKKKNILTNIDSIDAREQEGNLIPELSAMRALKRGIGGVVVKGKVVLEEKNYGQMDKRGDCNKYFHRVANGRQNRKFIKSLVLEERLFQITSKTSQRR